MDRAGLRLPLVTQVFEDFFHYGPGRKRPMTVEEGRRLLAEVLLVPLD